ncbi:PAS domain S-box protein [Rhodocaloribacter litoris]|uniref:PAS domain S-box protein n=1 Tax=Rhodocaloribacter litoris TaxID=2558931 RepID=UPI00141DDC6D|nr:PAS domain S-box protein [Rhodocaloribacter litoris]QXD15648.1 PAS domain S-box protein [Rhodocaloribacter litoris]
MKMYDKESSLHVVVVARPPWHESLKGWLATYDAPLAVTFASPEAPGLRDGDERTPLLLLDPGVLPAPEPPLPPHLEAGPFAILLDRDDPDREAAWLRAGALDVLARPALDARALRRLLARIQGHPALWNPSRLPHRHLFEHQTQLLALLDTGGRILDLNAQARRLLGWPDDHAWHGRRLWESSRWTDPTGTPPQIRRALQRARTGKAAHFEATLDTPEAPLPVRFTIQALPDAETNPGFLVEGQVIATQKRVEEALEASQRMIRDAFEHAAIGKALATPDGNILEANQALARFLGRPIEQLIGCNLHDFFPPEDRGKEQVLLQAVLDGERDTFQIEKRFLHAEDRPQWGLMSVSAIEQGASRLLVVQIQDITERKRYEEALRASQLLNAGILSSLHDLIAVLNPKGEIIAMNRAWEEQARRRNGTFARTGIGVNYLDICRRASDEDDYARRALHGIEAVLQGKTAYFEMEYPCPDDRKEVWYLMTVVPFKERGGVVVSHADITRRRQAEHELRISEERYRMLFEAVKDAILLVDAETLRILDANQAAQALYGYSLEELRRMQATELSTDPEGTLRAIERVKQKGDHDLYINERQHRRKDGTTFHVEISSGPITMGGRRLISAVIRDVTRRHEAEVLLRRSREQLRRLAARLQSIREEERTRLSREVHDVLGQALTGLRMDVSMLERRLENPSPALQERLALMKEALDDTVQVVRRIAADLRPGVLDDLGLVAALEWEAQKFEQRTGIACTFDAETEAPPLDTQQATAIFRVVQELLTNVARHAGATAVHLRIRQTSDRLEVIVQDNGCGIREEDLSEAKSLGILGMRERLLPWNGQLHFEGHPGQGTTVTVQVPLEPVSTQPLEQAQPS